MKPVLTSSYQIIKFHWGYNRKRKKPFVTDWSNSVSLNWPNISMSLLYTPRKSSWTEEIILYQFGNWSIDKKKLDFGGENLINSQSSFVTHFVSDPRVLNSAQISYKMTLLSCVLDGIAIQDRLKSYNSVIIIVAAIIRLPRREYEWNFGAVTAN